MFRPAIKSGKDGTALTGAVQIRAKFSVSCERAGIVRTSAKSAEEYGSAKSFAVKIILSPVENLAKRLGFSIRARRLKSMTMKENRSMFGPKSIPARFEC